MSRPPPSIRPPHTNNRAPAIMSIWLSSNPPMARGEDTAFSRSTAGALGRQQSLRAQAPRSGIVSRRPAGLADRFEQRGRDRMALGRDGAQGRARAPSPIRRVKYIGFGGKRREARRQARCPIAPDASRARAAIPPKLSRQEMTDRGRERMQLWRDDRRGHLERSAEPASPAIRAPGRQRERARRSSPAKRADAPDGASHIKREIAELTAHTSASRCRRRVDIIQAGDRLGDHRPDRRSHRRDHTGRHRRTHRRSRPYRICTSAPPPGASPAPLPAFARDAHASLAARADDASQRSCRSLSAATCAVCALSQR